MLSWDLSLTYRDSWVHNPGPDMSCCGPRITHKLLRLCKLIPQQKFLPVAHFLPFVFPSLPYTWYEELGWPADLRKYIKTITQHALFLGPFLSLSLSPVTCGCDVLGAGGTFFGMQCHTAFLCFPPCFIHMQIHKFQHKHTKTCMHTGMQTHSSWSFVFQKLHFLRVKCQGASET